MSDGVGTLHPAAPIAPGWALTMWQGPTVSHALSRVWDSVRDRMVAWLRPFAERSGYYAVLRLLEASAAYERALRLHVPATYDRAVLDAIADDPEVAVVSSRLDHVALEVLRSHPHVFGRPRARRMFPPAVMRDPMVRDRVGLGIMQTAEMLAVVTQLAAGTLAFSAEAEAGFETPIEERESPSWWAYDPGMPVEIARRLLAARRIGFALTLIRIARNTWTADSLRRAALDWADDTADYAGLLASLPGVTMPSVPADRRLDLALLFEHHQLLRAERARHLEAGHRALPPR